MGALFAASVHNFFINKDSSPTYNRYCSPSIMRIWIFIIFINLLATHASLPDPELYWKSLLPNTPIPKSIAQLLHAPDTYIHTHTLTYIVYDAGMLGHSGLVHGVAEFNNGFPPQFEYGYGDTKLQDNPDTALFFLEKDLKDGHEMNFLFHNTSNQVSFLPRHVVKSIPFSSTKMGEILSKFEVKPGSIKAEVMKNTIEVCEGSTIKGEDKYCATSLESMLDFTILKLGKNVDALCTEVNKNETKKQEYTITRGVEKVGGKKVVVCHKLNYVYAVFYCHKMENLVTYTVSLKGADGTQAKAVSVCHLDTSEWNPKHLAFQMLKVKPGSVPICHFLFQDSIAWVPIQN